jgi:hypothetical protein
MLFTRDEIANFIKAHPINTGGAIAQHIITQEEIDDGDLYIRVIVPYWSQNSLVSYNVLHFVMDAVSQGAIVFIHDTLSFAVDFYISVCDPD